MIALAHVEGAAVHLHAINHVGDEDIGVGVAVAVRICREVVGNQVAAHLDVHGNRLAVVAGYSGGKILRRLDAARSRLNRIARDGDGRAWAAGVGIKEILGGKNLDGGVGRHDVAAGDVSRDGYRLPGAGERVQAQSQVRCRRI